MNLLSYHRLIVSEGSHPHNNGAAKYVFTTPDQELKLTIRVTTEGSHCFVTTFALDGKTGKRADKQANVRLADGTVIARLGTGEHEAHWCKDVRLFAEKEFELIDEKGSVIEMIPKSSKSRPLEELGLANGSGIACCA